MSKESLKTIAANDKWSWQDFCRAHAYNTGENLMAMEKRAVVNTEKEKTAHKKIEKKADASKKKPAEKKATKDG